MLSLINLQWTLVSFRGKKLYFGLLQRIGSSDLKLTSLALINSKLQHSLPRATNGHLTVVYVGGWWVWTLAGCGGEVSSIHSRTHVFFLLMWRFFKVKSSLSWAGSERKVYKVWVLKLGQCEESHGRWFCPVWKIDSQIRLLGEHLNSIWPRGWQEFERTNLQKLKCPKGYSGVAQGVLKLRTDGRIDHKHKVNAKNIFKKMAWKYRSKTKNGMIKPLM